MPFMGGVAGESWRRTTDVMLAGKVAHLHRIRERFGLTGKERGPQLMSAMQDRYHRDVAAKHGLPRLEEEREKVPARVDALSRGDLGRSRGLPRQVRRPDRPAGPGSGGAGRHGAGVEAGGDGD